MRLIYLTGDNIYSNNAAARQIREMMLAFLDINPSSYLIGGFFGGNSYQKYMYDISCNPTFLVRIILGLSSKTNTTIWNLVKCLHVASQAVKYNRNGDIVFTRDSFTGLFYHLLSKLFRNKDAIHIHELHKISILEVFIASRADIRISINSHIQKALLNSSIDSILLSDGISEHLYEICADLFPFKDFNPNSDLALVYFGKISDDKGITQLLATIANNSQCLKTNTKLRLFLFGHVANPHSLNLSDNVIFMGTYSTFEQLLDHLIDIDKCQNLCFLLPNSFKNKSSYYTSPLKLFEYMCFSRPIFYVDLIPGVYDVFSNDLDLISRFSFDRTVETIFNSCNQWSLEKSSRQKRLLRTYLWSSRAKAILSSIHP